MQLSALDLTRVVTEAIEASRPLVDSFGHHLSVVLPDQPVPLRGDAARLGQVVANLLGYAAKYTEPGGHIHLSLRRQGNDVRLSVLDNGSGEASDTLGGGVDPDREPEPIEREPTQGGFGIGLTLVRRLVEIHGGTVKTYSAGPDQGSQIVVRLPVVADPAARPPEPPEPPAQASLAEGRSPALRILTVDDNPALAQALAGHPGDVGGTRCAPPMTIGARSSSPPPSRPMWSCWSRESPAAGASRAACAKSPRRWRCCWCRCRAPGPPRFSESSAGVPSEPGFDHHLVKPIDVTTLRSVLDDCARRVQGAAARPLLPART